MQRGLSAWGIQIGSFAAGWAPFVLKCFKLFHLHTGEANSYYPREPIMRKGNSSNFKTGFYRGFPVPGAFQLDHLHPIKPHLFWKFSNFFTFILGGQLILPQRANNGKREFFQPQKWMTQGVFSAWGIQTRPSASLWAPFVLDIFHHFHFHTGRPILITPEGP